jgi:hypothetical protein
MEAHPAPRAQESLRCIHDKNLLFSTNGKFKLGFFQTSQQSSTINSKHTAQISSRAIHLNDDLKETPIRVKKYTHLDSSQRNLNLASTITQAMYKKKNLTYKNCKTQPAKPAVAVHGE